MDTTSEISSPPELTVANVKASILKKVPWLERMQYSRSLNDRMLVEDATAKRLRSGNFVWGMGNGYYGEYAEEEAISPLHSRESVLVAQLDKLLDKRAGSGLPVVAVDFGAGQGLSMIRIAAQEKYKEAIKRGDLVMIATNLGFLPSQEADSEGYTGIAKSMNVDRHDKMRPIRYTDEELAFVQENQSLVTFLDATALELATKSVQTYTGESVRLSGHVDILHEASAVNHSAIPDVALAVFGHLLSQDGTFYLHLDTMHDPQESSVLVNGGRRIQTYNRRYIGNRQKAMGVGIQILQDQGLKKTKYDMYTVFTKPHAPTIPDSLAGELNITSLRGHRVG